MSTDYAQIPVQAEGTSVLPQAETAESPDLFQKALEAASTVPPPEETVVPPAAPQAKVEASPTPPTQATPAEEKKPERVAPVLMKLMEREAALIAKENEIKQREAEAEKARQLAQQYELAQRKFAHDPISFIRQMAPDINLADLAKSLWYENLGDGAPADYRATKEARTAKSTVEELRAEMEQKLQAERQRWAEELQQQKAEEAYHQYVGAIGAFAQSVPEEYPLVKSFASSDPSKVQKGLLKIAQRHAQETGGEVLTPAEAAARLNKELEGLRAALGVNNTPPPAAPKAAAPAVSTLRNKHQTIQPNRSAPDPHDEEAKFLAALDAVKAVTAAKSTG